MSRDPKFGAPEFPPTPGCASTSDARKRAAEAQAAGPVADVAEAGAVELTEAEREAWAALAIPVLASWGVRSKHGEWSDYETQKNAARDLRAAVERIIAARLAAHDRALLDEAARNVEARAAEDSTTANQRAAYRSSARIVRATRSTP